MDKYRKMYNKNFWGASDVSILKFYFASCKLLQQKGKVTDVSHFLDECMKTAADTAKYFNLFLGWLPFVNSKYGTEQERIAKFIKLRRKDIEKLFLQDDITDEEIENFLYGITQPSDTDIKTDDYFLEKVKEKILKCYFSSGHKKHLGDRIFGFLLKTELLQANTPQERLDAWRSFIGNDIEPSDIRLFGNPKLNRSNNKDDIVTLLKHLKFILGFYNEIGFEKAVTIIREDIGELSAKA